MNIQVNRVYGKKKLEPGQGLKGKIVSNFQFNELYIPKKSTYRAPKFIFTLIISLIFFRVIFLLAIGGPQFWNQVLTKSKKIKKSVPDSALNVFQVHPPVIIPYISTNREGFGDASPYVDIDKQHGISSSCHVKLMEHSFGNSYGKPFVGYYTPPKCSFNRVIINFRATCQGRQFDRLAIMYFNDTEVWRTSTAEPTESGIVFEYTKDMSIYMSLWISPQKLIFDLPNLIDETYTGPINTVLTATFSMVHVISKPADQIIPISARKSISNASSVFTLPAENAINVITLPQNANRAVFSLSACGQATEEFWWANVLQSDTETFNVATGSFFGYSPFREVQLLVDGELTGVHWPFPIIFTGGLAPGFWSPIVGIDTYDLREHEIDLTPWLGTISDGKQHSYEIRVVGIQDEHGEIGILTKMVNENWLVTGKLFLWIDSDKMAITTGTQPEIRNTEPSITISHSLTQNVLGENETLTYNIDVKRTLSISSKITTSQGTRQVSWTQELFSTNYGLIEAQGKIQVTNQTIIGTDESIGNINYKSTYSYPLWTKSSFVVSNGYHYDLDAQLTRGLAIATQGISLFPTGLEPFIYDSQTPEFHGPGTNSYLETSQNGTAHYSSEKSAKTSVSFGTTAQEFSLYAYDGRSLRKQLYYRNVSATNRSVTHDHERILGREISQSMTNPTSPRDQMIYASNPKQKFLQRFFP